MRGTLGSTEDGRLVLRFERRLPHPPEKVWRALTTPAGLNAWFPVRVLDFSAVVGAVARFDLTAEAKRRFGIDGDSVSEGCVTVVDPPSTLEYTWAGEVLRWELTPHGDGCLLVFTDVFDAPGETAEIRDGWSLDMVTGWHVSLDVLAERLAGVPSTASVWDRAEALKPSYPRSGE
ncbi:MAG TPA: SRPBCC family protein [Umezawaea sp.]|nr:SRPBCC family protein [Umezawaea sp.]